MPTNTNHELGRNKAKKHVAAKAYCTQSYCLIQLKGGVSIGEGERGEGPQKISKIGPEFAPALTNRRKSLVREYCILLTVDTWGGEDMNFGT
jgi:hypothetical protein